MIKNIRMVELEINKFCNRTCKWCPNSKIDRKSFDRLPISVISNLASELRQHNFGKNSYGGFISFSRNNEPFADVKYLDSVIDVIKDYLPYVNMVSNTNGDFFAEALHSKVDEVSIMDYDCRGKDYWKKSLINSGAIYKYTDGNVIYFTLDSKKIAVCVDWPKHTFIEDRAGFFDGPIDGLNWRDLGPRKIGCNDPSMFVAIDYNGNVTPCCCIRSDYHTDWILGNLYNDSLEDILNSFKAQSFRKSAMNPNSLPSTCIHCHKGIGRYTRENPGIQYSERYIKGGNE